METMTKTESTLKQYDLLVNGKITPSVSQKYFDLINPSTGEAFAQAADATRTDIEKAISAARHQFDSGLWPKMSMAERGIYLKKIAGLIRQNAKELAELESLNCGKTGKQSTFIDVPTAADCFEHFSNMDELKARENKINAPVSSFTAFEPIGVVACIIPWNYPLIMAAWKMAPALVAGNTIVFKPSALGCASILRLAQLIQEASLPEGVVNIMTTTDHKAASLLAEHPDISMVSFTGGTETGKEIMRLASKTAKKVSLELGGKSPAIVLPDCDLEATAGGIMSSIFMNQGQMCTAMARLLLHEKVYDKFMDLLVNKTWGLKVGPAMDYETQFGPVISREQQQKIIQYVESAQKEGAVVACGGKVPYGKSFQNGFYFEPTILVDVKNSMRVAQEEIFGPVLCVIKVKDEAEAVRVANDSPYGLAASIWTKDVEKANHLAKQLQCGTVWINTYGGFYNEASFGGYKQSGFGRELGVEGLLEYTQSKNICTDQTPGGRSLVSSWF